MLSAGRENGDREISVCLLDTNRNGRIRLLVYSTFCDDGLSKEPSYVGNYGIPDDTGFVCIRFGMCEQETTGP
jgi:hypothetical protein